MEYKLTKSEFMQLAVNHYYDRKLKERKAERDSKELKRDQVTKAQSKNFKKRGHF